MLHRNKFLAQPMQHRLYFAPLLQCSILFNRSTTMMTPEQFAAAQQANLTAMVEMSQRAFANVEKLANLNLEAARSVLEESAAHTKALLSAKDPQEVVALQSSLMQPAADKATAYGRQVQDIVTTAQAEVTKLVEAQVAEAQTKLQSLVETAAKNAPAGGEGAVAMLQQAMAASTAAFENAQKAGKQALSTAEANFQTLSTNATKAVQSAAQTVAQGTKTATRFKKS
jgi:phasin family protein